MIDEPSKSRAEPPAPRRVLLLGASGLIGSAVLARFAAEGVAVRAIARRPAAALANVEWTSLDLAHLVEPGAWIPHLEGIDVVVNCSGALQGGEALRAVHVDSMRALFAACERAGVRRVVHISAIGVERGSVSEYSATKRSGEETLVASSLVALSTGVARAGTNPPMRA